MKNIKVLLLILVGIVAFQTINVKAAEYTIKELVPTDSTATVRGEMFYYYDMSFNDNKIVIRDVRNNYYEDKPLSITIGLFDKDHLNIGTIIHCNENKVVKSKTSEYNYEIPIDTTYLGPEKTLKDIKYYSVISDNETCRKEGFHDYLGQKVEEIGKIHAEEKDDDVDLLLKMLAVVAVILVALFLYKFMFTNSYENMDNETVRKAFKNNQKDIKRVLKKERKKEEKQKEQEEKEIEKEKERIKNEIYTEDGEKDSLKDLY